MRLLDNLELCRFLVAPLAKRIDQEAVERWSQSFWLAKSNEVSNNVNEKDGFVMMLPPPNITGNLHLGHALTVSIEDAIIRHRRMIGLNASWIPGFDHAGLATQTIVEKVLWNQRGITRKQLGRDKFIEFSNHWKDSKMSEMKKQLDRLGLSLDYNKEFFTTDVKSSYTVQTAFKRLFKKGLIYRALKPVHWSKELGTSLSDIEIKNVDGVNRYIRTNEEVETRHVSQWFIDCKQIARDAVRVVQDSSISMIPENYKNSWSAWLLENGIQDWCISRQSWWGHRIPAFKSADSLDEHSSWVVADDEDEAENLLRTSEVVQDSDVLDTWFSSSLLPLTISGWPDKNEFDDCCRRGEFPLHVMETGFDILTFWVTKMVMMSLALEDKIPFKIILLHGMICDSKGKKMSKSKGNVIDPIDLIDGASLLDLQQRTKASEEQGLISESDSKLALQNQKKLFPNGIPACGADGLRAYLLSQDFQEEVIKIQISQIEKVRRLMNKLWNIYRFSFMILDSVDKDKIRSINMNFDKEINTNFSVDHIDDDDKKVIRDLSECVSVAKKSFESNYRLHNVLTSLNIFWNISLSTEYLPKLRKALSDTNLSEEARSQKLKILVYSLVESTKLIHPIMPHMSEFLYQKLKLMLKGDDCPEESIKAFGSLNELRYPK